MATLINSPRQLHLLVASDRGQKGMATQCLSVQQTQVTADDHDVAFARAYMPTYILAYHPFLVLRNTPTSLIASRIRTLDLRIQSAACPNVNFSAYMPESSSSQQSYMRTELTAATFLLTRSVATSTRPIGPSPMNSTRDSAGFWSIT